MAPSTIFSLFLFLAGLLSVLRLLRPKNGRKLPPGPRPLPIIGNLHMLGKLPQRALQEMSKKYGPIMSFWLGNKPAIVVSSPEAAELFLKTHDAVFAGRPRLESFLALSFGHKGMVFTPYGPYWRSVRKLCNMELLHPSKMESYSPIRREEIASVVASLKKSVAAREVVDFSETLALLVGDIMCRTVFGRAKDDEFDLKGLIKEAMCLLGAFNISDYLPLLGPLDLQGFTRRLNAVTKGLGEAIDKIIDEHIEENREEHTDFVDVLLSMINEPMVPNDPDAYLIDRTNIKAIMVEMIAGSFDSSSSTTEWVFAEIFKNPQVMKKLQDELESVVGLDRMVEEKDLPKLNYLEMVIKESMRLHSVAPLLVPHESLDDIEVNGYHIPKKTRVIVNYWAIGRDPNVWPNPEEFNPERFLNSNIDYRGREFHFLPFGSGRRGCPGIQMGLSNVRLIVSQLMHCFNWEVPHGHQIDTNEVFSLAMSKATPLHVMPTSYRLRN